MEKFLVTGGAGFIGSNICRRLVSEGCFVRVVDNLLTGKRSNLDGVIDKIDFVEGDMGDEAVARAVVRDVDVVLHEGALPSVPRSVDEPELTHKHCVDATFTLLLAARDAGVKRFVYAASSSAYGDTPTLPKVETMATSPLSPYAVGKLVGEYYCSVFAKVFGLETISLRYFNVFGPYQDPTSQYAAAIPAFVTGILKDEGFIDTRFFDDYSRDRGSLVHLATHYDDEGELDDDSLDPVIVPYVEAWRKFKRESGFVVEESEIPMYSATYRYAGIFDTRGVFPGKPILKRAAVELHNDGTYRMIPYKDRQDIQIWLSALACHTWKKNNLRRVA